MSAPLVLSRPSAGAPPLRPGPKIVIEAVPDRTNDGDDSRIAATAKSLAVACLEIFAGIRKSDSIARWVDQTLLERIEQRARLRAELAPNRPPGDLSAGRTLQARSARVCRIGDTIAEVTVVVRTQRRFRAVAIRLELLTTRWTMTQLETM